MTKAELRNEMHECTSDPCADCGTTSKTMTFILDTAGNQQAADRASANVDRNTTIKRIKAALKARSGKAWSVTGGRGTAWGWITIEAPPARRTWSNRLKAGATTNSPEDYEGYDTGKPGGYMSPADSAELGKLLGLDGPVHLQGESIAASSDHYREYIDRAEGREPSVQGQQYWD